MTIPLAALGRLNTHARAVAHYGQRNAIYAYKTLAAIVLVEAAEASLRFVQWTGKCNRCTNGRFSHWGWDDGYTIACRDCSGTGKRTLRFTETHFADGQVWHHPWEGRTAPGLDIARGAGITYADGDWRHPDGTALHWHDPGAWHPNQPADRLKLDELVALLNDVEDWVEVAALRERGGALWWAWSSARRHLGRQQHRGVIGEPSHSYMLDLGKAPGGCFVCSDENDLDTICFGQMTTLLHWSLPVCKTHRHSPHPKDPPPEAMITPEIRRWLDRHEKVEVVR